MAENFSLPKVIHFGAIMAKHVAEMHTCEFPEVAEDEVVLKMSKINLCTTDYQQWMGLRDNQGFPRAAGHEYSGIIVYKGAKVTDELKIGMQAAASNPFCNACENCKSGHTSECTGFSSYGDKTPDGYYGARKFADYAVVNQAWVVPIDKDIPAEQAAFLEPVATVVACIRRARVALLEDVVVIGAGTMGILNAQTAHAYGARVIISDIDEKKIARARAMGIADVIDAKNTDPVEEVKRLTGGKGADCVIAAVGSSFAYKQGYEMLRESRGRFVLFPAGRPKPEMSIDPNEIHYRRIEIIGTVDADMCDYMVAGKLIERRLIDTSYALEGKTFKLKDIQAAYAAASEPGSYRVTIDLQGIE